MRMYNFILKFSKFKTLCMLICYNLPSDVTSVSHGLFQHNDDRVQVIILFIFITNHATCNKIFVEIILE